jgi:hypothetical protein
MLLMVLKITPPQIQKLTSSCDLSDETIEVVSQGAARRPGIVLQVERCVRVEQRLSSLHQAATSNAQHLKENNRGAEEDGGNTNVKM